MDHLPRLVLEGHLNCSAEMGQRSMAIAGDCATMLDRQNRRILALIGDGLTTTEIASRLKLSPRTIKRRKAKLRESYRNIAERLTG